MKLGRITIPLLSWLCFAGGGLAFGQEGAAAPDSETARREAAEHFARGVEHADRAAWPQAVAEFQRAYAAVPHFTVLYNLGQSHLALDHPVEALDTLERYLGDGGQAVPPARRSRVEAQLAMLRKRVATLRLSLVPPDARLAIDGHGLAPQATGAELSPIHLLPGAHTVSADKPGHESKSRRIQLEAGQTLMLELELPPLPAATQASTGESPLGASATVARPAGEPPVPPARSRVPGYALGATALALGGTALGLYLWNDGRFTSWERTDAALEANPDEARQTANNELLRSIHRADWINWGVAAGAAATGTLAAVLLARRGSNPPERPRVSVAPAPGGVVAAIGGGW
jgi:hypothetical protein